METLVDVKPLRIPRPKLAGRELLAKTPLPDYDDPPSADKHHHYRSSLKSTVVPSRIQHNSAISKEEKA